MKMGLDIIAYQEIKLIGICDEDEYDNCEDWQTTVHIFPTYVNGSHFPEQLQDSDLKSNGVYEYDAAFGFYAGSYFGYNAWREQLAIRFTLAHPKNIWARPDDFKDRPFYFLVNFSDCEGIIAGQATHKLAADFEEHQERAESIGGLFLEKYNAFSKAFHMARENGFVRFL